MNVRIFAAVDIGSNAIRLLINNIYESDDKEPIFNKTSLVRIPIRLGHDSFDKGIISENTINRLSEAMKASSLLMNLYKVEKSKVFATSALRDAKNSQDVINKVYENSGVLIELIDGDKEANIILNTHLRNFNNPEKYYLYIDVGGGSTEISLLNNNKVLFSKSFKIGTVRILKKKVEDNFLEKEIKPFVEQITKNIDVEVIGSGGNINFIFKLSKNKEGVPIPYLKLKKYLHDFSIIPYESRMELYDMKPDRADVIIPALTIYTNVMKWANANKIYVPKIGAADGMIKFMYFNK